MRFLPVLVLIMQPAFAGDLPDGAKTPGAVNPALTTSKLCSKNFSTSSVRNVPQSEKNAVYSAYHMASDKPPCPCEVDHLISLELGGSNDQKNLWPQSYNTMPWNAHVKDKLENDLHRLVCAGKITLGAAQREIKTNWIASYKLREPH